jgi:acetoin utilization deacetylase AcuC-like enzyme
LPDYQRAWREELAPALALFRPQLFIISAGFDAHRRDPLADVQLETEDFATLTRQVIAWAATWAAGRIVSILEGGYDREALVASASAHLAALAE